MSIRYLDLSQARSEIRLLQLLPSSGSQYSRIPCCRLLRTGLLEAPPYKALSYAWGNAEKCRIIKVDNIGIRIPENLFNALIALRPPKSPILMWVDYLCINQQNDIEKAWQVALMGDIYKKADQVVAWLGPGDYDSQRAMEYLHELGKEAYLCGFYHDQHSGHTFWQKLAEFYSTHQVTLPFSPIPTPLKEVLHAEFYEHGPLSTLMSLSAFHKINGWSDGGRCFPIREMKNLLRRPWFGRVWVLQEIALSKEAVFVCGTTEIDRRILAAAMNAFECFRWVVIAKSLGDIRGGLKPYHYKLILTSFFRATTMVNAPRVKMMYFPLIALLRLTCVGSPNLEKHGPHHLDSSDPRDKIFALLGLASDRKELSQKGVNPDYTKSCREVYILATSVLLQQGHWSLLSFVQPHKSSGYGDLPSWVPDWYQPLTEPLQIVKDDHMTLEPEFGASGQSNRMPTVRVDNTIPGLHSISLKGLVCDTVHSVGFFPRRQSSWDVPLGETFSWPEEWLVETLHLTYRTKGNFRSFEERLRAVARASVGGMTSNPEGHLARASENILFEAVYLLRSSVRRIADRKIRIQARKFLAKTRIKNLTATNRMEMHLPNDMIGRSIKRLPFVTVTGRLGLGYDNIKAGDVVSIISGAQVPYILRLQPTRKYYNLISEAYVDGIMDGEALQGAAFTWLNIV
ncbi:HET-domain-containing protein [Xylaria grammica]|nr:HET-domain-containing protein [Xylaria grammica]